MDNNRHPPLIKCRPYCSGLQEYTGQTRCVFCEQEFPVGHVESELSPEVQERYRGAFPKIPRGTQPTSDDLVAKDQIWT